MKGKTLWNMSGNEYFQQAERKWREVYKDEKIMKIMYGGWERWFENQGKKLRVGDKSNKIFDYGNIL